MSLWTSSRDHIGKRRKVHLPEIVIANKFCLTMSVVFKILKWEICGVGPAFTELFYLHVLWSYRFNMMRSNTNTCEYQTILVFKTICIKTWGFFVSSHMGKFGVVISFFHYIILCGFILCISVYITRYTYLALRYRIECNIA